MDGILPYDSLSSPTEDADEGVGHEVSELVGCVALVDGAGARLDVVEDHSVLLHLPAGVQRGVWWGPQYIYEGCSSSRAVHT